MWLVINAYLVPFMRKLHLLQVYLNVYSAFVIVCILQMNKYVIMTLTFAQARPRMTLKLPSSQCFLFYHEGKSPRLTSVLTSAVKYYKD